MAEKQLKTRIAVSLPKSKIVIDEAAIKRWSIAPNEAPMQITRRQTEKVAEVARDLVGKDTWNLNDSIQVRLSANQTGNTGWLVTAGGFKWTRNASGIDYAAYHHNQNPFLTDALNTVGVQQSANAHVYY